MGGERQPRTKARPATWAAMMKINAALIFTSPASSGNAAGVVPLKREGVRFAPLPANRYSSTTVRLAPRPRMPVAPPGARTHGQDRGDVRVRPCRLLAEPARPAAEHEHERINRAKALAQKPRQSVAGQMRVQPVSTNRQHAPEHAF